MQNGGMPGQMQGLYGGQFPGMPGGPGGNMNDQGGAGGAAGASYGGQPPS